MWADIKWHVICPVYVYKCWTPNEAGGGSWHKVFSGKHNDSMHSLATSHSFLSLCLGKLPLISRAFPTVHQAILWAGSVNWYSRKVFSSCKITFQPVLLNELIIQPRNIMLAWFGGQQLGRRSCWAGDARFGWFCHTENCMYTYSHKHICY